MSISANAYDLELIRLTNKAKSQRYDFVDGKFKKIRDDDIFVLNLRGNSLGASENLGKYELFDKLYIITEEQKNKLSECKYIESVISLLEDIFNLITDEDYIKSILWGDLFLSCKTLYFKTDKTELKLSNNYKTFLSIGIIEEDFNIHGQIQVFKYSMKEFEKHNQIYINSYDVNDRD